MSARTPGAEPLLTPAEVASMFRVDPKTVTRWAKAGKLSAIRTLGGHRPHPQSTARGPPPGPRVRGAGAPAGPDSLAASGRLISDTCSQAAVRVPITPSAVAGRYC